MYIIAGCNGAGKTTASFTVLPESLDCREFVNADEIARGLSPFHPEKMAIDAARIMIGRIDELIRQGEDFAIETTLASKTHRNKIRDARKNGYQIKLLFFWLESAELAKERVSIRVSEGGHNIEPEVIERRYKNGIKNLFEVYLPIVDNCYIFDNSGNTRELIALKNFDNFAVMCADKFDTLKRAML